MTNGRKPGALTPNFVMKCVVAALPGSILPKLWPSHINTAFGLGLSAGVLIQHFIPPKGKLSDLFVLLLAAVILAFVAAKW
jgi:hypothetical protein